VVITVWTMCISDFIILLWTILYNVSFCLLSVHVIVSSTFVVNKLIHIACVAHLKSSPCGQLLWLLAFARRVCAAKSSSNFAFRRRANHKRAINNACFYPRDVMLAIEPPCRPKLVGWSRV